MKIGKLPKRADFDEKLEYYQQLEAEAARAAMAATLPGQQPQSTPRTPTPRGPAPARRAGSVLWRAAPGQPAAATGRALAQHWRGPAKYRRAALGACHGDDSGHRRLLGAARRVQVRKSRRLAPASIRSPRISRRRCASRGRTRSAPPQPQTLAHPIVLLRNRRLRPRRQTRGAWRRDAPKGYRAFAARGHFHEERGAVLMLQARRGKKAQSVRQYKATLVNWAAIVIEATAGTG